MQDFPENRGEEELFPNSFYEANITLILRLDKDTRRKPQNNKSLKIDEITLCKILTNQTDII